MRSAERGVPHEACQWTKESFLVAKGYRVTGLVRRKERAAAIESSGATAVVGELDDTRLILEQTIAHNIILHIASADYQSSVQAIIDGILSRARKRHSTIYIHTSGTSVLNDDSAGAVLGREIHHDNKREEIDSVSDGAPHRLVDLTILKAQQMLGNHAKRAIIIPPLIYGVNPSHKRLSIQIPTLTRFALKHGFAGHIGEGLSVESQIHVKDLARAYTVLLQYMEDAPPAQLLENPYCFCENGLESSWLEVGSNIGQSLYEAGKIDSPVPQMIPERLWDDLFGRFTPVVLGMNSRSRAVRLRQLGWKPLERSIWESYRAEELPQLLHEDNRDFRGYAGNAASYVMSNP